MIKTPSDSISELIRQHVGYVPETGALIWKKRNGNRVALGGNAAKLRPHGYLEVSFAYKRYLAHRVAWFLFYGTWPLIDIDHINRNRTDNRIANLRLSTRPQNSANRPPLREGLFKGVRLNQGKWCAQIRVNYRQIHLGCFETAAAAAVAYDAAALLYFGEFAYLNFPHRRAAA